MRIGELAEAVASGLSVFSVEHQLEGEDRSYGRKDVLQPLFSHLVRDVSDEHRPGRLVVEASGFEIHPRMVHRCHKEVQKLAIFFKISELEFYESC